MNADEDDDITEELLADADMLTGLSLARYLDLRALCAQTE